MLRMGSVGSKKLGWSGLGQLAILFENWRGSANVVYCYLAAEKKRPAISIEFYIFSVTAMKHNDSIDDVVTQLSKRHIISIQQLGIPTAMSWIGSKPSMWWVGFGCKTLTYVHIQGGHRKRQEVALAP